jgi:hypothetical protein
METPPYTLGERSGKGCSMKTAPRQLKGAHVPCTALRCHAAALLPQLSSATPTTGHLAVSLRLNFIPGFIPGRGNREVKWLRTRCYKVNLKG